MVEISMSSEVPPTGAVGYQNERAAVVESLSSSDNMTHSFGELRESGEWTVVTCKCCSPQSSLSDEPISLGVEKLVCTCSNISNIPADCSSNGSSSDVAVLNESDIDEMTRKDTFDMDGNPRISSLTHLSDKSPLNVLSQSINTSDKNQVDAASEKSLRKTTTLRLRLKNLPNSSHSSFESTNDGLSSFSEQRRTYRKSNKKSRRNKISDESVISMERTITFLLCLILISCVIAFSCLVFAFFARYFEPIVELSPPKQTPLFTDVEELEKEFTKCFDLKTKGQDCKINLKLWKKSLVELLVDENQRISKLIEKLDQVDENAKLDKSIEEKMPFETVEIITDSIAEPESENIPFNDNHIEKKESIEAVKNSLEINPDLITIQENENIIIPNIPVDEQMPIETVKIITNSNGEPESGNIPITDNNPIEEKVPNETIERDPYEKYSMLELFKAANEQLRILNLLAEKKTEINPDFSWVDEIKLMVEEIKEIRMKNFPIKENTLASDKPADDKVPVETEKSVEINPDLSEFLKKLQPDISPTQKTFINIPESNTDSTNKNHLRDEIRRENQNIPDRLIEDESDDEMEVDDEYEDIESDDGTETDEELNEWKTVEALKKQMEDLRNLYDLEKTENQKLKKVFEDKKQTETPQEEEAKTEDSFDFLGMGNKVWKKLKKTANNLNPHIEKYRKKLAKIIEEKMDGARELSENLRKKWEKNSEKMTKRFKKMQKAWNEEDVCDKDSTDCDEHDIKNADNVKDTMNELNSNENWYTKRFGTLKEESQDKFLENNPDNWIFKRAKGREEMHNTPKNNKKPKKEKKDDVKKKKKAKQE